MKKRVKMGNNTPDSKGGTLENQTIVIPQEKACIDDINDVLAKCKKMQFVCF